MLRAQIGRLAHLLAFQQLEFEGCCSEQRLQGKAACAMPGQAGAALCCFHGLAHRLLQILLVCDGYQVCFPAGQTISKCENPSRKIHIYDIYNFRAHLVQTILPYERCPMLSGPYYMDNSELQHLISSTHLTAIRHCKACKDPHESKPSQHLIRNIRLRGLRGSPPVYVLQLEGPRVGELRLHSLEQLCISHLARQVQNPCLVSMGDLCLQPGSLTSTLM